MRIQALLFDAVRRSETELSLRVALRENEELQQRLRQRPPAPAEPHAEEGPTEPATPPADRALDTPALERLLKQALARRGIEVRSQATAVIEGNQIANGDLTDQQMQQVIGLLPTLHHQGIF